MSYPESGETSERYPTFFDDKDDMGFPSDVVEELAHTLDRVEIIGNWLEAKTFGTTVAAQTQRVLGVLGLQGVSLDQAPLLVQAAMVDRFGRMLGELGLDIVRREEA